MKEDKLNIGQHVIRTIIFKAFYTSPNTHKYAKKTAINLQSLAPKCRLTYDTKAGMPW
jgi:hypothetical protein